jgi:hypothetical protein
MLRLLMLLLLLSAAVSGELPRVDAGLAVISGNATALRALPRGLALLPLLWSSSAAPTAVAVGAATAVDDAGSAANASVVACLRFGGLPLGLPVGGLPLGLPVLLLLLPLLLAPCFLPFRAALGFRCKCTAACCCSSILPVLLLLTTWSKPAAGDAASAA